MPRNPDWTEADAATILAFAAQDDRAASPFLFDDPVPTLDVSGRIDDALDGAAGASRDVLDLVAVELAADGVYSFLANGAAAMSLSIFDSEGYLLLSADGSDFGIDPALGTIYQFLPDADGLHYVGVSYTDPAASGDYSFTGEGDFGEVDPTTGNTAPLARDLVIGTTTFRTTRIDPAAVGFDAEGDPLEVIEVETEPRDGIAFVLDGELYYRSSGGFAGVDGIGFRLADGEGGTDVGFAVVPVLASSPTPGGVTVAQAQLIAYLYEAGLDRDGNIDQPGLNFWIDTLAAGVAVERISAQFLASTEFRAAFGDPDLLTDRELVEQLYRNVLDREGEEGGIAFWESQVARSEVSRADLLTAFAQSAENAFGSPEIATLALGEDGDWGFA